MARLLLTALEQAGYAPRLASRFRAWLPEARDYSARAAAGRDEAERVIEAYAAQPPERRPKLWFTYHLYYRAPDWIGPRVAAALGAPYVVAEASRAAKRLTGPWAEAARDAEAAIDLADAVFCMTGRDRPALAAKSGRFQSLIDLPPFLEAPDRPADRPLDAGPARLLTAAMMRPGDKAASYRALAAALALSRADWRLEIAGDGPDADAVRSLFAPFGDRVRFLGQLGPAALADAYDRADLFVWPGVGEAYGMVYLEARARGAPVLAEDRPGVRDVLGADGLRAPPDDPRAFAAVLDAALSDRAALRALGRKAWVEVRARHGMATAAEILRAGLAPLFDGGAAETATLRPSGRRTAS